MAAADSECTSSGKTVEESSSSFFQLSLNTQEGNTRVGVLGVKVKPTKTENVIQYFCDICNVSLNSQIQSAAHYQGKSHQNKVKSAEKIAEAIEAIKENSKTISCTPPEVPSDTSTAITAFQSQPVISVGKIDNSMSCSTSKKSTQAMLCEICQKSFNSDIQAQQHFSSKAHQNKIKILSEPMHSGLTGNVVVPLATTKPAEVKLGKNINTELCHCSACNITLNSKSQLKQHNRGLRHKIMTGKASAPPPSFEGWEGVRYKKLSSVLPDSNGVITNPSNMSITGTRLGQYYCQTCDISVNSQNQLNQHLASQKHIMGTSVRSKKKSNDTTQLCSTRPHPTNHTSEVVGLSTNSLNHNYDQQLLSSNDKLAANRQQVAKQDNIATGSQSNQFHCKTCNLSVNSQTQLNQHLSSQKHLMVASVQPIPFTGGQGCGQVQAGGKDSRGAFRGRPVTGRGATGRGRSSRGVIPLSMSFVKRELYQGGAVREDLSPIPGAQVRRGARGVWRGQPRRGQRVTPY